MQIGGVAVRVGGIAKGSGMIHPNMATMLSVVTCDAAVDVKLWRALFKRAAVKSFNQVRLLLLSYAASVLCCFCGTRGNDCFNQDPFLRECVLLESISD